MSSLYATTLNNAMANQLMEGTAESVQRLASFGVDEGSQLVWMDDTGTPHTETLWHWSHRAPSPEGVEQWWLSLQWRLEELPRAERARLLHDRLNDAFRAAGASGQGAPLLASWAQCLGQSAEGWSRRHMFGQLIEALETQGDQSVPWLQVLGQSGAIRAQDWSVEVCQQAYPQDPLYQAMEQQAFVLTLALLDQGADPKERNQPLPFFAMACREWGRVTSAQQGPLENVLVHLIASASPEEQRQLQATLDQTRLRETSVGRLQSALRQRQLEERPASPGRSRSRHRS